jgi:hypothetical protein
VQTLESASLIGGCRASAFVGNVEVPNQALSDKRSVLASIAIEPLCLGNHLNRCPAPPARFREPVDGLLEPRIRGTVAAECRELGRVSEVRDCDCGGVLRHRERTNGEEQ